MKSLYIHIPFCESRCIYCGFYSTTDLVLRNDYVDALVQEMMMREAGSNIGTIYLGGGTPSQLTEEQLRKVLYNINKVYNVERDAEITIECNPDDIDGRFAGSLADMGFNRVSLGAQTFSDERLQLIRRRHSARQVDDAVTMLRKAGIRNISIDIMFGFPGETLEDWENDISHALSLEPQHISAYTLMVEENTVLHRLVGEGKISVADDELCLAMFEHLTERLASAGYEHYEISNFAKLYSSDTRRSEYRSVHNSNYWADVPYIGIGAAAHSYDLRERSWNVANITEYIRIAKSGKRPTEGNETIDSITHYNDIVTTAMRTREGIPLNRLTREQLNYLLKTARLMAERGLVDISDTHVSLTHRGIFVSDSVMAELIKI
ncbi:MAG: radical SAM family heme chaperone HemW [Prevotella sp.]|uniref:radical SAM family heme chaperone HemW n=1 Tax=Prevotella sp. TaxID=59823 RepID=UPI002A33DB0A|nr:radical SAM family heme chaperone HemW [Prevotella sp.]MDD7319147.1 radical SAM family heme chaperone HemW [Prevotellaceae bacterium]MDY4020015.1 radical SAM family heme chaperone HemW [Prevotella sp.]